ncbi:MAG: amidohydrolase [Clostridia bacterium]|nr:amidohydrolase [Clostridia bacterium]
MLLIKNGILHTMEKPGIICADILADKGKTLKIGENICEPEAEVFDARGLHVYPGIIDAHSHIGISEEKVGVQGDDCNETTSPITPWLRAVDAINPMDSAFHNALAAGITGVMAGPGSSNPIGGQFAFIKTCGRRIDDMIVKAPAAIKIAFGENPKTNYGSNGNTPASRMTVAAMIREELFAAREYFENDSSEKDFRKECYRELFEHKIPLKAHAHRADDIFTAIRIAEEFGLGLTLDHCTEGHLIAEEIAKSGYPAIVGPSMASRSKIEVEQSDFKTPAILHKAGVTVALTTDHPVTRIQHLPICAALAAKHGLGDEEAMKSITINAAKICRVDDRLGSIKEGKDADFAIFTGSPLEVRTKMLAAVVDGKIAYTIHC